MRGAAALSRLVKLGFRRWLWIENRDGVRTKGTYPLRFQSETPYQARFDKPRQRGYAARGVFKLGYGKPFFNYSKTRFASFAGRIWR